MDFHIETGPGNVADADLVSLLTSAYVGGGFSSPQRAATVFEPSAVRSRGDMICACSTADGSLAGMVIVVLPDYPARRMASADEAELHLLAVDPIHHGRGIGRSLMVAALASIHAHGLRKAVLWTQPTMTAAHRLYESLGFERAAARDPTFDGIAFLAYQKRWP